MLGIAFDIPYICHMPTTEKILVLTYGSRGDVEPFIALANGLAQHGHAVTLSTAERYGDWVKTFGLAFEPLPDDIIDLMDTPDGKAAIEGGSVVFERVAAGFRLARKSGPLNEAQNVNAWRVAQEVQPDLIVHHPKVIAAPHIAEALDVPAVLALLQPMVVATHEFPPAGMPNLPIPGYNRFGYSLVNLSYGSFRKSINTFRKNTLKLPPVKRRSEVLFPNGMGASKVLHAISPAVIPRPKDWPDDATMTGYWGLKSDEDYLPPDNLRRFLEAGPPPVYIGFGSMPVKDPQALQQTIIDALGKARVRGVISTGWARFDEIETDRILTIPSVPHSWLFPRMAAVVHHGGMGTTAQGFRAGVPCVICPFFGDQPYWAKISVSLGVGAPSVPRGKLSADTLSASIIAAVNGPSLRSNARSLAEQLKNEDGLMTAIAEIENTLANGRSQDRPFV
ncbi:MAG: glycosyltransferase [Pseudomonadota bacterium]